MLKFSQKKSLFTVLSIMVSVQLCAAFPSVIDLEKTAKAETAANEIITAAGVVPAN